MKLTNELKARFFAQYWGQEVMRYKSSDDDEYWKNKIFQVNPHNISCDLSLIELLLKPLSSITYEDAIEVSKHIFKSSVVGDIRVLVLNRLDHFTMIFDNAITSLPKTTIQRLRPSFHGNISRRNG